MKPEYCSKHAPGKKIRKTRYKIKRLGALRLTVTRSNKNIFAQVFEDKPNGSEVLVSASSLEAELRTNKPKEGGKTAVARMVGQLLGKRAKEKGIEKVAFDRSGFMYHGRVKALAEGVREEGVNC